MKIALDADGVLSDFVGAMCGYLFQVLGVRVMPPQITNWLWYECDGVDITKAQWDEAFAGYWKENRFAEQRDFDEAIGAVERLRRMGHEMRIFTVRPEGAAAWRPCRGIEIPVTYCDDPADKACAVARWGADVFVDDHVANCEAVASLEDAPWVLLFERPYNADGWTGPRGDWDTLFEWLAHREMENAGNDECGMMSDERGPMDANDPLETFEDYVEADGRKIVVSTHHGHPRFYALLDEIVCEGATDITERVEELLGFDDVGIDPWRVALHEDIRVSLEVLQSAAKYDESQDCRSVSAALLQLAQEALTCRLAFEKTSKRKRLVELLREMRCTHDAKNHDYAGIGDPLRNFRMCEAMGLPAWKGCLVRITDKVSRLQAFAKQGELRVKDESVADTLLDLANYAILCRVLFEECREPVAADRGA